MTNLEKARFIAAYHNRTFSNAETLLQSLDARLNCYGLGKVNSKEDAEFLLHSMYGNSDEVDSELELATTTLVNGGEKTIEVIGYYIDPGSDFYCYRYTIE